MEDHVANKAMQIAGWKKEKDGNNYLSMQISPKQGGGNQVQSVADAIGDDIPF